MLLQALVIVQCCSFTFRLAVTLARELTNARVCNVAFAQSCHELAPLLCNGRACLVVVVVTVTSHPSALAWNDAVGMLLPPAARAYPPVTGTCLSESIRMPMVSIAKVVL